MDNVNLPDYTISLTKKQSDDALWNLEKIILNTLDFKEVVQKICDSLLLELDYLKLGYRIVVLALADKNTQVLKRISISRTPDAVKALQTTPVPFPQIDVSLQDTNNLSIKVLDAQEPSYTTYWPDILSPAISVEDALMIQKTVGIKTSLVYPVVAKNKSLGIIIFSMAKDIKDVSQQEKELIARFTDIVGLAVQNSELYSSLEVTAESLKQANSRLQELDKMKDEFVSLASHELRTPMTAIKSYIWMALDGRGGPLSEKQKYYIDRAYKSTDRLINLVNEMLNISRIESGRITIDLQIIKPDVLVQEVIDEVMPRAQELGVKLEVHSHAAIPEVLADGEKIKEVLINLIGNSFKFTQKGGSITIQFVVTDTMVEIQVADTGIGVSPENQGKLFQKFSMLPESYASNPSVQGTGLGLFISKSIIDLHKGKIWVHSEGINKGTTFAFSLPVAQEKDKEAIKQVQMDVATKKLGLVHTKL